MNTRRKFLHKMIAGGSLLSLQGISSLAQAEELYQDLETIQHSDINTIIQKEDFWKKIQAAFAISKSYINLNNGGVSPQAKIVQESEKKHLEIINEMPSYQLWRVYIKNRPLLKQKLAQLLGSKATEIAILQNTTEAINTIMLGIDWQKGDEIILSKQDYSSVRIGWEMLARRKGVKLVWVNLKMPLENDKEIIAAYTNAITNKTRFVHLTQVINWTGQILPSDVIKKICLVAKEKNIFTLVDGAHAFAQLDFKINDLGCDAFACSLHKWLGAPLGMGMLYLQKDKIRGIWSMYPSEQKDQDKIEKFEHSGTISMAKEEATHTAIAFHNYIGIELKEARLRYLKDYWAQQFKKNEHVYFYTSFKKKYACAIALFDIKHMDYKKVSQKLHKARIHHTTSVAEGLQGIRFSPNIYTTTQDLDYVVDTLQKIIK